MDNKIGSDRPLTKEEKRLERAASRCFSLQKGKTQDENWAKFRQNYNRLILTVAKRAFEDKNFDKIDHEAIFQEACISYLIALDYHNLEKKTKQTTSYVWMFQKRLKSLAYNEVACYTDWNPANVSNGSDEKEINIAGFLGEEDLPFEQNESCLEREEELLYSADLSICEDADVDVLSEESQDKDSHKESQRGSRYLVCTESFIKYVDSETHKCLKAISSTGDRSNNTMLNTSRSDFRSSRSFIKKLRENIKQGLEQKNVQLYQAVCLNGSRNIVFVAGRDMPDAEQYLKPYGALIEIKQFNIT